MRVYRLSKSKFKNDIQGIGAELYGGRWNEIGTACVYTSENRSLAILEYSSNVNLEDMPRALHITTYNIPEDHFVNLEIQDLPGDWRNSRSPASTKRLGTDYLKDNKILGIRVPSAIVAEEFNYIINPGSVNIDLITIIEAMDFVYDVRIKE